MNRLLLRNLIPVNIYYHIINLNPLLLLLLVFAGVELFRKLKRAKPGNSR